MSNVGSMAVNGNASCTQVTMVGSAEFAGGVQLVDTESVHSSDPNNLVQMALQIQKADQFTRANACSKLAVIGEQVRFLQEQARQVLEEAHRNAELHHVACNFKKVPGQMHYLYLRPNGQRYFSRISPQEWGPGCPNEFIGAYKLQHDMSWTEEKDVDKKDDELHIIHKIIDTSHGLQTSANLSIQFNCNP